MKITVDTNEMGENEAGELLRGLVFDQRAVRIVFGDYDYSEIGCYTTFETREGFVEVDPEQYRARFPEFFPPEGDGTKVTAYESPDLVAMWWWDSDGSLLIWPKGEKWAYVNTDCKCDYTWERMEAK